MNSWRGIRHCLALVSAFVIGCSSEVPVPTAVRRQHRDWSFTLAYSQVAECATWGLQKGGQTRYLKLAKLGWEPSLASERDRLAWAATRLPVPRR